MVVVRKTGVYYRLSSPIAAGVGGWCGVWRGVDTAYIYGYIFPEMGVFRRRFPRSGILIAYKRLYKKGASRGGPFGVTKITWGRRL